MLHYIVRAYLLNNQNKILLIKHKNGQPRVLPGGHVEEGESLTSALKRELNEELGITGTEILGMKNRTNHDGTIMKPTPISIHEIQYKKNEKMTHRLEFWYFVRTSTTDITLNSEIVEAKWFSIPEVLSLTGGNNTFLNIKDVLEQNEDLLELL